MISIDTAFENALLSETGYQYRIKVDTSGDGTPDTDFGDRLIQPGVRGSGKREGSAGEGIADSWSWTLRNAGKWYSDGQYAKAAVSVEAKAGAGAWITRFTGFIDEEGGRRSRSTRSDDTVQFRAHDAAARWAKVKIRQGTALAGFAVCDTTNTSSSLVHYLAGKLGETTIDVTTIVDSGSAVITLPLVTFDADYSPWVELQDIAALFGGVLDVSPIGRLRLRTRFDDGYTAPSSSLTLGADPSQHAVYTAAGSAAGRSATRVRCEFGEWEQVSSGDTIEVYRNTEAYDTDADEISIEVAAGAYWPGPGAGDVAQLSYRDPDSGDQYACTSVETPTVGTTGDVDILYSGGTLAVVSFNGSTAATAQGGNYSEVVLQNTGGSAATIKRLRLRGVAYRVKTQVKAEAVATGFDEHEHKDLDLPGRFAATAAIAEAACEGSLDYRQPDRAAYEVETCWLPHIEVGDVVTLDDPEGSPITAEVVAWRSSGSGMTVAGFRTKLSLFGTYSTVAATSTAATRPSPSLAQAMARRLAFDDDGVSVVDSGREVIVGATGGTGLIRSSNYVSDTSGWQIDGDGNAELNSVTVRGTIYATAGIVGGFTIDATDGLYAGTGVTRVQMKPGAGFWAGATAIGDAPFRVTEAGALTATSATITGAITATSGTFAGVTISGTLTMGASGEIVSTGNYTLDDSGLTISTSGTITNGAGTFTLDNDGIAATAGAIGGWTIGSTTIESSDGKVEMDAGNRRFVVYDGSSNVKVALGYLGGVESYTANDFGLYVAAGNTVDVSGDATYAAGDWAINSDAAFVVYDSTVTEVARFGSIGAGDVGLHVGTIDPTAGTGKGVWINQDGDAFYSGTLIIGGTDVDTDDIGQTANKPSDADLVAYYPMDEGSGTTAADVVGGADITWTSGSHIDGVAGKAHTGAGTWSNVLPGATDWAISVWAKAPESTSNQLVIAYGSGGADEFVLFKRRSGLDNQWQFEYANIGAATLNFDGLTDANTWHHFVVAYDGTTMTAYLDGAETDSYTGAVTIPAATTSVGYSTLSVDDLRIYNRALTPAEIRWLYNNPGNLTTLGIEPGATVGADWSVNLDNVPASLGTPNATGVYVNSTNVGFYNSGTTSWPVRIYNDSGTGKIYAGDGGTTPGTDKFFAYDGTNLTVSGGDIRGSALMGGTISIGDDGPSGAPTFAVDADGVISYQATQIELGYGADASGTYSVAIGWASVADAENATAVGVTADAGAIFACAFGRDAVASGEWAVAVGTSTDATGGASIAIGKIAQASASGSIAIGASASAATENSVSIGTGASCTDVGSIAFRGLHIVGGLIQILGYRFASTDEENDVYDALSPILGATTDASIQAIGRFGTSAVQFFRRIDSDTIRIYYYDGATRDCDDGDTTALGAELRFIIVD